MFNYIKFLLIICTFLFSTDCYSQKRGSAQIPVSVSLIRGTKISKLKGDFNFNDIKSKGILVKEIKSEDNNQAANSFR